MLEAIGDTRVRYVGIAPSSNILRVLDVEVEMIAFEDGEQVTIALADGDAVQIGERLAAADPRLASLLRPVLIERARRLSEMRYTIAR